MAPLEPWEKVLVDPEAFLETVHGQIACIDCHGGEDSPDKETAHTELHRNPSAEGETVCGQCHPNRSDSYYASSLHATQLGYWTALEARGLDREDHAAQEMFGNHCASCHTTCGDCHVSQPGSVGGGFIDGHVFQQKPSLTRNCTACHGSRVGNEFLGKHEGLNPDVHFSQGRMVCIDCHTGDEMHGDVGNCDSCHPGPEEASVPPPDHRYGGVQQPRCETCHAPVTVGNDGNPMHAVHGADLSCQVCHSLSYTSCDGCHVSVSEKTGKPFFSTEGSYLTFFIGRNPNPTFDRPYKFVPVRHVPAALGAYDYYGANMLDNFDALPTWVYTTPHNIQRITPQSRTCDACHGNPDLFLTADKVAEGELNANLPVIMESVPEPVTAP